jgi:transcriptional regulator of arginine metabolism
MKGRDRRRRLLKILELVSTREVGTQEEIAAALTRQGWEVTQSSVSRDIAALGLVKVDGVYRRPAAARRPRANPDEQHIVEGALAVEKAGDTLVVVHTPPGEANRVALALDRLAWPDVAGTVAGDDTIFVAVRERAAQARVHRALRSLIDKAS